MKHVLHSAQRGVLEELARADVLLGFDFDGTLVPIVTDPARAALEPRTRKLLAGVAKLYPCAVISGRSVRDLERRLRGIALRGVIGNHGAEPWAASAGARARVRRWREQLREELAELPGVALEDKTYSLAIHYRGSRKKRAALARIRRAVRGLGPLRMVPGKQVVNVLPPDAPHKGEALERERLRLRCELAFFVGDDETDEDVFALDRPGEVLTVRVGRRRGSRASYFLRRQGEIDALLERLIVLRQVPGR